MTFAQANIDGALETYRHDKHDLDQSDQYKLGLLITLDTKHDICALYEKITLPERGLVLLNLWRQRPIYLPHVHENKIKIYRYRADIEAIPLNMVDMLVLQTVYFNCSYIAFDHKHDVKENINALLRKYFSQAIQLPDTIEPPPKRKKPKIIICLEYFKKAHAMYRCWGVRVASLKEIFDVTIITLSDRVSSEIYEEFDDVFVFDQSKILTAFQKLIQVKPDIVYFPSLGMEITTIIFSNYRFAPIQIMTLGHPATPHSPHIDAVVGTNGLMTETAFPHEKLIIDPAPIHHVPNRYLKDLDLSRAQDMAPKEKINICIAGTTFKLSGPFMTLLQEIENDDQIDAKFTFLTNSQGLELSVFRQHMQAMFKNFSVDGYQPYEDFFKKIQQTDIALVPYPFGHSNTMIDSLLAKKPTIAIEGSEPHERSTHLLKQMGLEAFAAHNPDEYKAKFYAYAEQILAGKRDFFDPHDLHTRLYAAHEKMSQEKSGHSFGDTIKWIHDHRDEILSSDQKIFHVPMEHAKSSK